MPKRPVRSTTITNRLTKVIPSHICGSGRLGRTRIITADTEGSMSAISEQLDLRTDQRDQLLDITARVQQIVDKSGVSASVCTAFIPHTTAGVTINENADPDVVHDLLNRLDELVPWRADSDRHGEGNSAAHLKAALMGSSVQVLVVGGRLALGTWQGVFFCEFDGPRSRQVWISVAADQESL